MRKGLNDEKRKELVLKWLELRKTMSGREAAKGLDYKSPSNLYSWAIKFGLLERKKYRKATSPRLITMPIHEPTDVIRTVVKEEVIPLKAVCLVGDFNTVIKAIREFTS